MISRNPEDSNVLLRAVFRLLDFTFLCSLKLI